MPDISAIITFHREGVLAHTTLFSIERCRRFAEEQGGSVEFVITLDRADDETRRIARNHPVVRQTDHVLEVNFGDLSLARNSAIEHSKGDTIAILDGDDYFSENWLASGLKLIHTEAEKSIYHPEMTVAFGTLCAYWWQVDQSSDNYDPHSLLVANLWNACTIAPRKVFLEHPYAPSKVGESGFGYEDWHWNCETIAAGYVHRLVPGTVRFERRKASGSLNVAHDQVSAIIGPSAFFDQF